jgi:hypothetical protein
MILFFNNTASYEGVTSPIRIDILALYVYTVTAPSDLDTRITNIVGPAKINDQIVSWTTIIAVIIPMIMLVSLGVYNTGVGIIGCGLSMGFVQAFLVNTDAFNATLILMCPLIIVIGILYIWTKGRGEEKL